MKKLILFFACILSATGLMAQHVSEAEALEKAQAFLQKKVATASGGQRKAPRKMRKLAKAAANDAFYVFNAEAGGGFVIVSGDERTEEILGYSTEGNIDLEQMPENMRAWLKGYEEQIMAIPANYTKAKVSLPTHPAVAPMITAKWDQGAPYYMQCPTEIPEGGTEPQHCLTGCVATAMAQIMYYWKWPQDYTTTIPAYDYGYAGYDEEAQTVIYNMHLPELPPVKFEWANMKDTYNGTETDASADAVATLMRYCGQSVKMDYTLWASGANANPAALINYFGYDEGAITVYKENYTAAEWDELIYTEMQAGRPVWYGGYQPSVGHSFVCDGYDGNGFYHINWGWSGSSNGFFQLSVLSPSGTGSGGGNAGEGYCLMQDAVIGIQKPGAGERPVVVEKSELDGYLYVADSGSKEVELHFSNFTDHDVTFDGAVNCHCVRGNATDNRFFMFVDKTLESNGGQCNAFFYPTELGLEDGDYLLYASWIEKGKQDEYKNRENNFVVRLTVENGQAVSLAKGYDITVSLNVSETSLVTEEYYHISAHCESTTGVENIPLYLIISDNDDFGDGVSAVLLDMDPGEQKDFDFGSRWIFRKSGIYHLRLATGYSWNEVLAQVDVEVAEPLTTLLPAYDYWNERPEYDWVTGRYHIPVVNNGPADYSGLPIGVLVKDMCGDWNQLYQSEPVTIAVGDTVDIDIPCDIFDMDRIYEATFCYYRHPTRQKIFDFGYVGFFDKPHGSFETGGISYDIIDDVNRVASARRITQRLSDFLVIPATVVNPDDGNVYSVRSVRGVPYNFNFQWYYKELVLAEGFRTIDDCLANYDEELEVVSLPSTLACIGAPIVDDCPNLKHLYMKTTEVPALAYNYQQMLGWQYENLFETVILHVPTGCRESYAKAWPLFKNIVEMDVDDMPPATPEDLTARVGILQEDWHAGGMVGYAAPEVTTRDGRTTPLAERYEETAETMGTMMEQTVTGLQNGHYRVTLYANACYTPNCGFNSGITDGQTDMVYLFANDTQQYIPVRIADSVEQNGEYTLTCNVTDGTLHLGMVAAKAGTNWHSMQIKSLDRVGNLLAGDADGNGRVDIADVTTTINYIQGQNPAGFNRAAADVNGDGSIDIVDVTRIVDLILKK